MEYLRSSEFFKKYNMENQKDIFNYLLFSNDWWNDEDEKIYFGVFMVVDDKVLDDVWVVVVNFNEVDDGTTFEEVIKKLDEIYTLIESDKIKGAYKYVLKEDNNE